MPAHKHTPMDQSKRALGRKPGFNRARPYAVMSLSAGLSQAFAEIRACETCFALYYVEIENDDPITVDINDNMKAMKERGYEGGNQ